MSHMEVISTLSKEYMNIRSIKYQGFPGSHLADKNEGTFSLSPAKRDKCIAVRHGIMRFFARKDALFQHGRACDLGRIWLK